MLSEARYGVSALRDVIQVQNGGSVTNTLNRPEYVFATTGPGSVATMKTAERCRYARARERGGYRRPRTKCSWATRLYGLGL
jgi:hypothetical protein